MNTFSNELKVKVALQLYFSKYHFKDGGYHLKWFTIKTVPVFIPIPNIKARVDAVKFHDIPHLITEFNADYKGETEIGGWEIASGCGKYYIAWMLNLGSMLIGIIFYPRALLNAFLRGRKCAINLYYNIPYDDLLLNKTVGELRQFIEPSLSKRNQLTDYIAFVFWCLIAFCYHAAIVLLLYKGTQSLLHFVF